jgi:hypothetical protein
MKSQKLIVIAAIVCLLVGASGAAMAQDPVGISKWHKKPSNHVQPDIPGLVAEVVAQGLAAEGYAVRLDGTTVKVATHLGELILDLPATQEALEKREITVSVDGMVVMLDDPPLDVFSQMPGDEANGPFDLIRCIFAALDIYGLKLNICDLSPGLDFLCIPEATFELVLNVLRCIGDPF